MDMQILVQFLLVLQMSTCEDSLSLFLDTFLVMNEHSIESVALDLWREAKNSELCHHCY